MTLSIVLPAYQEAENLKTLLPQINGVLKTLPVRSEVIVIDTVETMDGTMEVCAANNCRYYHREGGNTYGDAVRTGITKASMEGIIFMDADCSHNPLDIAGLYNAMNSGNYDCVIASRYTRGGSSENNRILKFMSWMVNVTYRLVFNLKVKDVSNSFRMYNAAELKALDLQCNNFDIVEEVLIKLSLAVPAFKVYEAPVHFAQRKHGVSKRNLLKFVFTYLATIKRLLKIKHAAKMRRRGRTP